MPLIPEKYNPTFKTAFWVLVLVAAYSAMIVVMHPT